MVYINKNVVLNQLTQVVKSRFEKKALELPESFQKEQLRAIEIFKKRFLFEEVIEESIHFNKKLNFDNKNSNLQLTTTAEELVEVFKLRSDVYDSINYLHEFPDTIEGLNFDSFDKSSAIVYYKNNNKVTGSIRLIFDSEQGLPTEEKYSFNNLRKQYDVIGEMSRYVVYNSGRGLNLEFKYLMSGVYNVFINNKIDIAFSGIKQEHLKLYKKLGGVDIVKEMDSYGTLKTPFYIISYNPNEASKFFKKVFLNEKVTSGQS